MNDVVESVSETDDEISLIDLFAVVVRYRKLIIAGTLVAVILAAGFFFVLPKAVPSLAKQHQTVYYNLNTRPLPVSLKETIDIDVRRTAISFLTNVYYFSSAQKEFSVFADEAEFSSEKLYNLAIKEAFAKKQFSVAASGSDGYISVECEIPVEKAEALGRFMKVYVKAASDYISAIIMPQIDALYSTAEEMIAKNKSLSVSSAEQNTFASVASYEATVSSINLFKSSYSEFVFMADDGFAVPVPLGRVKKIVIVAFAAFFLSVFLAFALNAVENIKNDKEASSLLKKAWKDGK
ncbi:MAG: hypothetical protein J6K96_03390 [Treponema sp.]|nr:hypothetical protein [Treponema sp.]